ncbi:hypothetical protein CSHISOI_03789 [Colletotrichum shisoi]|uniref:DUF7924 domain-containing protein n=1 Tax=Colletotrichum shisoi TaxID=2078593 RepID=A0A5Q4BXB9_9PEZI|nr:hypothetical protein CSHISOI_03789 [Colletotrichum shisoi]
MARTRAQARAQSSTRRNANLDLRPRGEKHQNRVREIQQTMSHRQQRQPSSKTIRSSPPTPPPKPTPREVSPTSPQQTPEARTTPPQTRRDRKRSRDIQGTIEESRDSKRRRTHHSDEVVYEEADDEVDPTIPKESLFADDLFKATCRRVADRNEARVIRDITPLVVPSAEISATYGAAELDCLIESINEGWNNAIPLAGTRPQPDYSVGFKREAFTEDQLEKLSPFIGDFIAGDQSFFMATYLMHFPFLTCEVKCGAAALDIADRQNAHSGTLAVRAIVELFRLVKREEEVNRQILSFSISHDHRSVRIYGHYPEIDGKRTEFFRYPIHTFDFTAMDGKDKWTAYCFTKNVYSIWMPTHVRRICSAIDQLPSQLDFDVPSLPETGLSQELECRHLSQSDVDSIPASSEADGPSGNSGQPQTTPNTSFTGTASAKKARTSQGKRR